MSFKALSAKAVSISAPYLKKIAADDSFWKGSDFDFVRKLPSRTRGSIGQTLTKSVFEEYGYSPRKRGNFFEIGKSVIISRSSMLWETDEWKFQQVRNVAFDFLFCLGLYPDSASAWLIPKDELFLASGGLTDREGWDRQHGGRKGSEDAWLVVSPPANPKWLAEFGGEISRIPKVFKRFLG